MDITTNTLIVPKTARYFSIGTLNEQTKEVWIVLHGYAQLASDFIQPFSVLNDGSRFIVAPEGLNKFYAKGFGGKPAATWMTSEDRLNEIKDYTNYLDVLYNHLGLHKTAAKIVLLGFSQGVATASRWLYHSVFRFDQFIIYAGEIGAELQNPISTKLLSLPVTYITGSQDKLISPEKLIEVKHLMNTLGAHQIVFDGGHEIKEEVLLRLV